MIIAKQMDVRANIKKYFDLAYDVEPVIVPRKQDKNVVILSEREYNRLRQYNRLDAYSQLLTEENNTQKRGRNNAEKSSQLKAYNLEKLDSISKFKKNWNGNGAPAFSKALIKKVQKLVNELTLQPEIFPTALCTIQLEYDNSRKDHMEIEIDESDTAELFIVLFTGTEYTENIRSDSKSILEKVLDFYG